jgi:hypothetical protein
MQIDNSKYVRACRTRKSRCRRAWMRRRMS